MSYNVKIDATQQFSRNLIKKTKMGSIKGQKHNPYIKGRYAHINPNDVVFTPDWLAKQIVEKFPIEGNVLEPCKG